MLPQAHKVQSLLRGGAIKDAISGETSKIEIEEIQKHNKIFSILTV